jgi:hypothetical protein
MDQTIFNVILAAFSAVLGWFGKTIWANVRALTDDVAAFREEVAKDYVRKDDFNRISDRIFEKLDLIYDKLDKKMDK